MHVGSSLQVVAHVEWSGHGSDHSVYSTGLAMATRQVAAAFVGTAARVERGGRPWEHQLPVRAQAEVVAVSQEAGTGGGRGSFRPRVPGLVYCHGAPGAQES